MEIDPCTESDTIGCFQTEGENWAPLQSEFKAYAVKLYPGRQNAFTHLNTGDLTFLNAGGAHNKSVNIIYLQYQYCVHNLG